MTDRERYKRTFGVLHTSRPISLEGGRERGFAAGPGRSSAPGSSEVDMKRTEAKRNYGFHPSKGLVAACLCACLLLGTGVTAWCCRDSLRAVITGWRGNATVITGENGEGAVILDTDSVSAPVIFEDGRLFDLTGGEPADITAQVSQSEPYITSQTDEDGNTHYFIVGLNSEDPSDYGFAEYIRDADGQWAGGYSVGTALDENGAAPVWLTAGMKALQLPWAG